MIYKVVPIQSKKTCEHKSKLIVKSGQLFDSGVVFEMKTEKYFVMEAFKITWIILLDIFHS